MDTIKRSLMVVATAFAMASSSAVAGDVRETNNKTLASKAVQMTDEQLDEITAAGATFTGVIVFNAGNAFVEPKVGKNHMTCVNCLAPLTGAEGTFVILGVINGGHPMSDPMLKCLGRCPSGLPF
jgi:hypothetical protein